MWEKRHKGLAAWSVFGSRKGKKSRGRREGWVLRRVAGVLVIGMVVLAGCAGREGPSWENLESQVSQEEADSQENQDSQLSAYPKVASLPKDIWTCGVMNSEGCYCICDGSHFGFMTEDGEEITPFIYEEATPFSEGLACVYLDGKYGYIGKDGKTKLPFIYDQASPFSEGMAYYCIGDEYGFINQEGEVVLQPECDSISSFREGKAYFSVDGRYGYIDQSGRILVEPVYEDAGYFQYGKAMVAKKGRLGVIGETGKEILAPDYDMVEIHEDYIFAEKDGMPYCFDQDGKRCLQKAWEEIRVWQDGLFTVKQNGRYGLTDRTERMLLEPEYDAIYPIPGEEMAIIRKGELFGVVDFQGNEKIPFIYSWISYETGTTKGGLRVTYETSREEEGETVYQKHYGYLEWQEEKDGGAEGAYRLKVEPIYDYMSSFVEGRAVVGLGEKYGVIREDGILEYPVQYDKVRLFEDGSLVLKIGELMELKDPDGKRIRGGYYEDILAYGNGYRIKKNGKYGLLDSEGNQVVAPGYDYCGHEMNNIYSMSSYGSEWDKLLVKMDDTEGKVWAGSADILFQNQITPRVKGYRDFLQNVSISQEGGAYITNMDELRSFRRFSKLYRMQGSEDLVLHFYAEPYERMTFPMSYSGFFLLEGSQARELVTGYECGGSMRGDCVCFWYDTVLSELKFGVQGSWGGFGGYAYSGYVFDLQDKKVKQAASFYTVEQTRGNYSTEDLLEHAGMFYDVDGNPYTEDSILDAEIITEYEVDGTRITKEHYEEIKGRYQYRYALDTFF